ncbi:40-kDa huntingtin-associated protein-like [Lethenteron reissneri]|uniref:40-kDa huntingtin-associated protein-like n=1 Tax=Lethenteron reissneri TaxID=7753 RepID=UPI002AB690AF|nr:40-kDa huntingtin-associated protein-like [Lethenteron reissneri]
MMEGDAEFWGRYRAISSKLRKRFLRKPNVAEASEQFGYLSRELKQQECLQYAGFCSLAQARCEQTVMNGLGEAEALTEAARLFLKAEVENWELRCPGLEENLQAAINAYNYAVKVYIEINRPALAASLCLEIGYSLKGLERPGEAEVFFQRAAELQYQMPIESLHSLGLAASCKLLTRDYMGALNVFTEMQLTAEQRAPRFPGTNAPIGAFSDIIARSEVARVLLLMLLQPPPQRLAMEHAKTLERYAWESFESPGQSKVNYLTDEVFLLLQSVVVSCQEKDIESLKVLQKELWPLLSTEQNHLMHLVIQELLHPSGMGY